MACRDIAPSQNQSDQDRDVFAVAKNGTLRAGRPLYSSFGISGADNVSVISSVVHIHQSTYRKIVLSGQDFTFASLSLLDPQAISAAGINVIVISNGTWRIIKRYRELFKCPYPIYVDETRQLYEKMGMVLLNNDFGPMFNGRAAYNQRSAPSQLVHGLKKAFVDLPIGRPGKLTQLGGEFILSMTERKGLQCHFAHRMTNTSNHMEAFDVLQLAGCDKPTTDEQRSQKFAADELAEIEQLQREEEEWREGRTEEIERIQRSRAARRQHLTAAEQQYLESSIRRLSIPTEAQEDADPTESSRPVDAH